MASSFWALSVGSGEAFLLKTQHEGRSFVVLVDGGRPRKKNARRHKLVEAIHTACPGLTSIDVAICTHQDSDHAGGLEDFADHWALAGGSIGEYWLPGSWSVAFPWIVTNLPSFLRKLTAGAREAANRLNSDERAVFHLPELLRALLSEEARDLPPDDHRPDDGGHVWPSLGLPTALEGALFEELEDEAAAEHLFSTIQEAATAWTWPSMLFDDTSAVALRASLTLQVIDTARRIRKIALSAIRNGVRIRWFDFAAFEQGRRPEGGHYTPIKPVNSVELARPITPSSDRHMFLRLYLSAQNVESLVFARTETEEEPGVLFLGDSRLAFGELAPTKSFDPPEHLGTRPYIVTAPHHGSRTNDHAYEVLNDWEVKALLVRNGGHWKSKLGEYGFRNDRRCAHCTQCGRRISQVVQVNTASVDWDWVNATGAACP